MPGTGKSRERSTDGSEVSSGPRLNRWGSLKSRLKSDVSIDIRSASIVLVLN
jgi:hypothetical protein